MAFHTEDMEHLCFQQRPNKVSTFCRQAETYQEVIGAKRCLIEEIPVVSKERDEKLKQACRMPSNEKLVGCGGRRDK